ncbi:unnamed protein product [Cladocopium goreaui]|uniref:Autophagy-related protein 18a n=1 Tax=Cladocopium goreaui TaxID=2562237 RepID=A0A9P1CS64_9DINO|nr:unnamed protein product [Cladocopium goreaui]
MAKWSLLWPLTFGVASARSSEPTAFCSDDIAYLQTKASQAICDPDVLNSGRCVGDGACFGCVPASDGQKIPTDDINGFPTGFLLCENNPAVLDAPTCTISRESPFAYSFQNPKNYLQCTGSSACYNWRVKDFAALCCDGNSACRTDEGAQVTNEANFALTSGNPNCPPDVCCRGIRACSFLTNISGVSSAACSSSNACEQVTMFLSRDLFCSRRDACKRGIFRFSAAGTGPSKHCVHCFDMSVVDDDSSGSRCFCSGAGCTNLVGPLTCETPLTVSPCGQDICKEDRSPRAFCDRGLRDPPDCSACASGGGVVGDPHITTLDGRRYTMLQQGNFLLWSFSGLDAEVPWVNGQMKRIPLDFRIYTHYSGRASFTKGILLVDRSGAAPRQALEVTSLDCAWKTKSTGSWRRSETEFLKLEAAGATFGAFNVTAGKAWHERQQRQDLGRIERSEVQLLMRQKGWTRIAQLRVTCKPGHHIAAKLKMSSTAQNRFVKGELAPSGHSTLVAGLKGGRLAFVAKDTEFAADSWRDLGGSQETATYLASTGAEGWEFLSRCEGPEETAALAVCQKHWALAKAGDSSKFVGSRNEVEQKANFLADCAFDVCAGGETAAQLAADLLNFE